MAIAPQSGCDKNFGHDEGRKQARNRQLVGEWAKAEGVVRGQVAAPSFAAFRAWARLQGHSHYFEFRSTMGAIEDCERWFDQELGQTWRN